MMTLNPQAIIPCLFLSTSTTVLQYALFSNGYIDTCNINLLLVRKLSAAVETGYTYDSNTGYNDYSEYIETDHSTCQMGPHNDMRFDYGQTFQICKKASDGGAGGAGAGGDPHIKTWTGTNYDFMGECDLILAKSEGFGGGGGGDDGEGLGDGFEIQIRTEIRNSWSFVSAAALKIGNDVLEVHSDGLYYLNGEEGVDLLDRHRHSLSDYPIRWSQLYLSKTSGKKGQQFNVNLGANGEVVIRLFDGFDHLKIMDASFDDFGDSIGLMGSFNDGKLIGRDGVTVYDDDDDIDAFSMEWQVGKGDDDVTLFHDAGTGPQYPTMSKMPDQKSSLEARRLSSDKDFARKAEAACSGSHSEQGDIDACLYDVLATGNLDMAEFGAF